MNSNELYCSNHLSLAPTPYKGWFPIYCCRVSDIASPTSKVWYSSNWNALTTDQENGLHIIILHIFIFENSAKEKLYSLKSHDEGRTNNNGESSKVNI